MNSSKTRQDPESASGKVKFVLLLGIVVASVALLAVWAAAPGGAVHLRWDLIHLTGSVLDAGGIDWAKAADGSQITLTGSGTWLSTSHGAPQAVSGAGTWEPLDKE